ncbi:MAG: PAS domain-containing sensor histidine kinase [Alphaproteobacteria bacterium]|nr:MAG: PAS domain-containing sensor histidine kinase [Alphaproteobacteria bacterium]
MKRTKDKRHNRPPKKSKSLWLNSGLAQAMVLMNGIIITITAFLVFSYFIKGMSVEQYKRTSQDAGRALVEGVSSLENTMRLVTSIILLSESDDKDALVLQLRRNVPDLSRFDQIIWIFEESPGDWQYETIFETTQSSLTKAAKYRLVPDQRFIMRLINDGVFKDQTLHLISDFKGMDYVQEKTEPLTMVRSFALVKTVKANQSSRGVVIGVSRAGMIFDQNIVAENSAVSRLTIRDLDSGNRIYHMNRDIRDEHKAEEITQNYSFFVGDSKWQVLLEFTKEKNTILLEKAPYIILFFGSILTAVGTLFIRNNHRQATKLASVNFALEQKNCELLSEVSERERLNSALAVAEKDNRAIIDSVRDVIFETDMDGIVLFLSAAWHQVTGFEIERSKGSNLFSILYPDDQDKQRHDYDLFIKGQKQSYNSFTRIRISDGTFRAIELSISMIRRDENNNLRVVGTITDVEERRRAERALAEAEKKYRMIVENAAGGLYQLTPEGIYLSANPAMAHILEYNSPVDMLRLIKNAYGLVYPDKEERVKFMETLKAQGQIFGYEIEVLTKDGHKIWVRENIRLVKDEQNNILYYEGSMEDITQRKEADIALLEAKMHSDMANRAKTEFIANMSHELRTPLNAIIGFSDIMKNEVMGPLGQEMYKEYVTDIHSSGEGLLKIINEILDISKIEAGDRELNESEFSVSDVLGSCLDLYDSRLQEKDIILMNEAKIMPNILGEELSIKQVISNIYTNAIKYTPKDGRITLFSNSDIDGSFRLSITDTGIGMSEREIRKALSPFGQIDNALDRSGTGVGLGLPLAQAIMGIHGGRIEILSEKSIGTTVTLFFPSERVINKNSKTIGYVEV